MEKQIFEFLTNDAGVIVINDDKKTFISGIEKSGLSEKAIKLWQVNSPPPYVGQQGEIWELFDAEKKKYYRITTSSFRSGKGLIQISFMLDITEYTSVFKNISRMSAGWEKSSKFQTSLIKKLSGSYDTILPDIARVFDCAGAALYIRSFQSDCGACAIIFENNKLKKHAVKCDDPVFEKKERERNDNFICYQSDVVGNQSYVIFLNAENGFDKDNLADANLYNVIRLFIENSLLKEQIVYDSEHDRMTGLFNKGKYMSLLEQSFGNPDTIAVFNMDVNNLKAMNDTYGHEMGDRLIIKASESLKAVQSENILGFRLGGDEFMMIAKDIGREAAENLRTKWENATENLNKRDDGIPLVIACGMAFGNEDYDLKSLLAEADRLMYEDKQKKKSSSNGSIIAQS